MITFLLKNTNNENKFNILFDHSYIKTSPVLKLTIVVS